MQILFSGIQPTGEVHLGNYLGALKNWVALQKKYSCIFCIVDYHALTQEINPEQLHNQARELTIDLLSLGIDPKKSILFKQSDVPEHTELAWIFSCLTPVAELERMTQYKDAVQKNSKLSNTGMFTYPVLQAADILLYNGAHVPVGEDQLQHLELSRIIARKFNNRFGNFFSEPKPVLSETVRVMGLDNPMKKMSKSNGPKNYIALRDEPELIQKKISKAVTGDSGETTLGGGHNLLMLYKQFGSATSFKKYEAAYKLGSISYAELKKDLSDAIIEFIKPIQEKRTQLSKKPKIVDRVLSQGAKKARTIAQKNIASIKKMAGLY